MTITRFFVLSKFIHECSDQNIFIDIVILWINATSANMYKLHNF